MSASVTTSLTLSTLSSAERERIRSGIRSPRVIRLTAGERIYRFASSYDRGRRKAVAPTAWATGPWWIREDDFLKIEAAQQKSVGVHGPARALTLGFLARQAAAVMQEWSEVDRLVMATMLDGLDVFAGRGRTQFETPPSGAVNYNLRVTWSGWDDIEQLYLPGLDRGREGHTLDGRRVFEVHHPARSIASQQLWARP